MKYLFIESCTERGVVVVMNNDVSSEANPVIESIELPPGLQSSRFLMPAIEELLAKHLIQAVVVGIGPGSYTGIRVGASAAKSIAYGRQLPLIGVCTLEAFVPKQDGRFAAVIDAKIGGIYLLKGEKVNGEVTFFSEPMICEISSIKDHLADVSFLCTPNAKLIKPRIEAVYSDVNWTWLEMAPNPFQIGKGIKNKLKNYPSSTEYHLDLLYLRKTQAELEREQKLKI